MLLIDAPFKLTMNHENVWKLLHTANLRLIEGLFARELIATVENVTLQLTISGEDKFCLKLLHQRPWQHYIENNYENCYADVCRNIASSLGRNKHYINSFR